MNIASRYRALASQPEERTLRSFLDEVDEALLEENCDVSQIASALSAAMENRELLKLESFGGIFDAVWINDFALKPADVKQFVAIAQRLYPDLPTEIHRMQACVMLTSLLPEREAAEVLLALYERNHRDGLPVVELLWELVGMKRRGEISAEQAARIEHILSSAVSEN